MTDPQNRPGWPFGRTVQIYDPEDISKNRLWAALAYFGFLFFLPLAVCPDSQYGRFHANQGLILFLFEIAGGVLFRCIPFFGGFFLKIYGVLMFILLLIGMFNAFSGKTQELPIIGGFHILK